MKRVRNHKYLSLKDAAAKLDWNLEDLFLELTQGNENDSFSSIRIFAIVGSEFRKNVNPTYLELDFDPEAVILTDAELSGIEADNEIVFEELVKRELTLKIQDMIYDSDELHSFQLNQDIHDNEKNSTPLNMVFIDRNLFIKFYQNDEIDLTHAYTLVNEKIVRLDWKDTVKAFPINIKQLRISNEELNKFIENQQIEETNNTTTELKGKSLGATYAIIKALLHELKIEENDPRLLSKVIRIMDNSEYKIDPRIIDKHINKMLEATGYSKN